MITKRMINCDFFYTSGFKVDLSNKAKLLYFMFFTNADDKGFVGNGKDLAETLDRCEENFENTLFAFKYVDAIQELVDKHLLFEFSDKVGNKIYLIKHWYFHNKELPSQTTNYISLLTKVELIDNEYHLRNHTREKELKEKEIKENKKNQNLKSNSLKDYDNDLDSSNNKVDIDALLDDLDKVDKEKK